MQKIFWPIFFPFVEHEKGQEANNKGPEDTLTVFVEVIRSLL